MKIGVNNFPKVAPLFQSSLGGWMEWNHKLAAVQFSLQPSSPQVREAEGPRVCQVKTQKPKKKHTNWQQCTFLSGRPQARVRRAEGPRVSIENLKRTENMSTERNCQLILSSAIRQFCTPCTKRLFQQGFKTFFPSWLSFKSFFFSRLVYLSVSSDYIQFSMTGDLINL